MGAKKIIEYDMVFQGTVVGKEIIVPDSGNHDFIGIELDYYRYTFHVTLPIKGIKSESTINIYSITQSSACGVDYAVGDGLMIFAYKHGATYFTGLCCDNKYLKELDRKYENTIKEFRKCSDYRTWRNVAGEIEAAGKVVNQLAEGMWTYHHSDGSVEAEGEFTQGLKEGEWKYYFNQVVSEHYLKSHEYSADLGDPKNILSRVVVYEKGVVVKSQSIWD